MSRLHLFLHRSSYLVLSLQYSDYIRSVYYDSHSSFHNLFVVPFSFVPFHIRMILTFDRFLFLNSSQSSLMSQVHMFHLQEKRYPSLDIVHSSLLVVSLSFYITYHGTSLSNLSTQIYICLRSLRFLCRLCRSEEHTSELQSRPHLVCRLLLEKKKNKNISTMKITIKNKMKEHVHISVCSHTQSSCTTLITLRYVLVETRTNIHRSAESESCIS